MKEKIKELYNCKYIVPDGNLYPLQEWYNKLIDKTVDEITTGDVLKMIRQNEFVGLAMTKAMDFLRDDVFAGETYDGELLDRISEMDIPFLKSYADELMQILKNALKKSKTHEWFYEGEREEFEEIINSMLKIL